MCFSLHVRASDFRKDYGKLCALCALFPDIPCLAMTATASQTDMKLLPYETVYCIFTQWPCFHILCGIIQLTVDF